MAIAFDDTDAPVRDHAQAAARSAVRQARAAQAPKLANPVPPAKPPEPSCVTQPKPHRVSAWRHDGGMTSTRHETEQAARDHAATLSYVLFWKYAIIALAPWEHVVETKPIVEAV